MLLFPVSTTPNVGVTGNFSIATVLFDINCVWTMNWLAQDPLPWATEPLHSEACTGSQTCAMLGRPLSLAIRKYNYEEKALNGRQTFWEHPGTGHQWEQFVWKAAHWPVSAQPSNSMYWLPWSYWRPQTGNSQGTNRQLHYLNTARAYVWNTFGTNLRISHFGKIFLKKTNDIQILNSWCGQQHLRTIMNE